MVRRPYAEIIKKLDRMLKELPNEEFEQLLFPTKGNWPEFEKLVAYTLENIEFVKQHEDSKMRFEIMKNMISKIKDDGIFDPMFDSLREDGSNETRKASIAGPTLENYRRGRVSRNIEKRTDSLCRMYAFSYEKTCREYIRPLAQLATKRKIETCGAAIREMLAYDNNTAMVLEPFNAQIRNSIDHNDWYIDYPRGLIVFEDRDKEPIEMKEDELRLACELQMVSHVCITTAINDFKAPLLKAIIEESRKVTKYCEMLGLDHDAILKKYLNRGISLFQINLALEKMLRIR